MFATQAIRRVGDGAGRHTGGAGIHTATSRVGAVMLLATIAALATPLPAAAKKGSATEEKAPGEDPATLAKAKALFKSGQKHYDLGEYKEALVDFKEAYRLKDDPSFLYNIAQSARQLGEYTEAADRYRTYLRKHNPANRAEVEVLIAEMEQKAAAKAKAEKAPAPQGTNTAIVISANQPPQEAGTNTTVVIAPETATTATTTAPAPEKKSKTWLYATIGVVAGVVVLGAVGVGLGVGLSSSGPADPKTGLGTYSVGFQ